MIWSVGRSVFIFIQSRASIDMAILHPVLDILPQRQRVVWKRLAPTPKDFVLYGGTALALRLGHRESVDFDFFSQRAFQAVELLRSIPYLKDQAVVQESENTLSCNLSTEQGTVSISFFGGLTLGQLQPPGQAEGNGILVASLIDIFGMKCAAIPQRNEVKDYLDIHALITRAGISLAEGITAAGAIYGRQYSPVLTLQALSYFDDLPQPLPEAVKVELIAAVKSVALDSLPAMAATGKIADGVEQTSP